MKKQFKRLLKVVFLFPLLPVFGIPGLEEAGADAGDNEGDSGGNEKKGSPPSPKKYDEAELDKIAGERSEAAKNKALSDYFKKQGLDEGDAKKALEEYKAKKASEAPTAEKLAEAERKALEAVAAANKRIITAEAKALAVTLGVKPDRVPYLLRMADIDGVDISEDGAVDEKKLKAALEKVLSDIPELKTAEKKPGYKAPNPSGGQAEDKGTFADAIREKLYK